MRGEVALLVEGPRWAGVAGSWWGHVRGWLAATQGRGRRACRGAAAMMGGAEGRAPALAEAIPQIVWTARPDGRSESFNGRFYAYTGLSPEECREGGTLIAVHPRDRVRCTESWREAVAGGRDFEFECRLRRADGAYRWHLARGLPVRDAAGRVVRWVGTTTEINDQKRAEAQLQAHARQQAVMAELGQRALSGAEPQALMDELAARLAECLEVEFAKVLELRPDGESLLLCAGVGWRPGLVGRRVVAAGRGSQAGYALGCAGPVIVEDLRTEPRFRGPSLLTEHGVVSGMSVLIPGGERPFGVLGVHTARRRRFTTGEIHVLQAAAHLIAAALQRKRYEAELARSEERFRKLVQDACDVVTVLDAAGTIRYQSPSLAHVLGHDPAGRVGKNVFADPLVPPEDLPRKRAFLDAAVARPGVMVTATFRMRHADGSLRVIEARGVNRLDDPSVGGIVATYRDVTERTWQEAALRAAKGQAEAASRAKDRFLATLSHELRTPLTPALLAASALLDGDGPAAACPAARPDLEVIRRGLALEARLIDDLLDAERIARGKLSYHWEVVDPHALICQTLEICRNELDAGAMAVVLDLAAGPGARHVRADPARLQQVLWNLVRNAVKFTPGGGTLTIRTRLVAAEAGAGAGRPRLVVEVADTGIGIDPAFLPRVFDAFEQEEAGAGRRPGGLGLGLAIGRGVAAAHGGSLSAASAGRGHGATFRLELPTVPAPAAPRAPAAPAAPAGAPARGLAILLVEDDPPTRKVLTRLLTLHGHAVTAAEGVTPALAAAEAAAGRFDLVVSDLGLPDGSGLELMAALHDRHGLRGIALSGFGTDADRARSHAAGFSAHLTKPIDYATLEAAIRRAVDGADGP